MSLFELLVVLIVAFLVLKPEDVPHIAKKLKDCYNFFTATKAEITSYLDLSQKPSIKVDDDIDQINFYLEKIANLGGKYEGEYSLTEIRDYYQKWQRQINGNKEEKK
jgi:Sec-independent protein translocase protein TatA